MNQRIAPTVARLRTRIETNWGKIEDGYIRFENFSKREANPVYWIDGEMTGAALRVYVRYEQAFQELLDEGFIEPTPYGDYMFVEQC